MINSLSGNHAYLQMLYKRVRLMPTRITSVMSLFLLYYQNTTSINVPRYIMADTNPYNVKGFDHNMQCIASVLIHIHINHFKVSFPYKSGLASCPLDFQSLLVPILSSIHPHCTGKNCSHLPRRNPTNLLRSVPYVSFPHTSSLYT